MVKILKEQKQKFLGKGQKRAKRPRAFGCIESRSSKKFIKVWKVQFTKQKKMANRVA